MRRTIWEVPRGQWKGEDVFLLAGGPSLAALDVERLRGRRVIALNDAGLVRAPWADVLFWADARWFKWNLDELEQNRSTWRISRAELIPPARQQLDDEGRRIVELLERLEVKFLFHDQRSALSSNPGRVAGRDVGGAGINLAWLFGPPRRLYLAGYDFKAGPGGETHWHQRHRLPTQQRRWREVFMPAIERMAPLLKAGGVEVFNLNPDSALRCFPFTTLDQVLA